MLAAGLSPSRHIACISEGRTGTRPSRYEAIRSQPISPLARRFWRFEWAFGRGKPGPATRLGCESILPPICREAII